MNEFTPIYDLESLNEAQRQEYVRNVCKHMGVPDNLNLVSLVHVDEGEGPARLVAYAKRGATENVRNVRKISIESLTSQMVGGSIVFTAVAKDEHGRQEIATGSKWIDGLTGTQLDDGLMTASTRALRRVTLQFIGAGVLDESEVNQRKVVFVPNTPIAPAPQPTVQPSSEAGKDVTMIAPSQDPITQAQVAAVILIDESQKREEQARAEAIAKLNQQAVPEEPKPKKTRKPRGPNKSKVDLGPSEVPAAASLLSPPAVTPEPLTSVPVPQAAVIAPVIPAATLTAPPPVQNKPKLTADQSKPFRQRYFRLMNDYLEPAGFAPVEGMGNTAKMRALAQIMFPDVSDMNQLDEVQWEKYLSLLENKVKEIGPKETIKFIESTIGL